MKIHLKILLIVSLYVAFSCDDVLDRQPLDIINDNMVWNDETLIESYLLDIYGRMIFLYNDLSQTPAGRNDQYLINIYNDQATNGRDWTQSVTVYQKGLLRETGGWEYWDYSNIRRMNEFLEKIEKNEKINTSLKDNFMGRIRFARAYTYFTMVKRYGGIPLIREAQSIDKSVEELQVPRSTEMQVYDFIISECDALIKNKLLPETLPANQKGYPTVFAAHALKSRAALYAASISRWGKVQNNGLVGIPADQQNRFWQICYDASKALINGPFSLYKKNPANLAENFRMLFIDENNPEVIWAKYYDGTKITNDWSVDNGVIKWTEDWLTENICPYLEFVEEFEKLDGTSGKWDRKAVPGKLWTYDELFGNLEPRFHAQIFTMGSNWCGFSSIEYYNGIRKPDGTIIRSGVYNGIPVLGNNYRASSRSFSGFGIKKGVDPSGIPQTGKGKNMQIQFRLAEIILNFSEAAYYLNKMDEALASVNQIRQRVNLPAYTEITEEKIMHERSIELAFEPLRHWDLKRWRIAKDVMTRSWTGVNYILDYNTRKFLVEYKNNFRTTGFDEKHYYLPITPSRISNNPKLAPENPGY